MTILTYGMVWVLWLIVNRFLCEYITMVDGYLTFAQIAGEELSVRTVLAMRWSSAGHCPASHPTLQASSASSRWNGQVRLEFSHIQRCATNNGGCPQRRFRHSFSLHQFWISTSMRPVPTASAIGGGSTTSSSSSRFRFWCARTAEAL
jgi:hypothetical protein